MAKTTAWFPGGRFTPPVERPGLYETSGSPREKSTFWRWWDGKNWGVCCRTVSDALRSKRAVTGRPAYFRALAEDPGKSPK